MNVVFITIPGSAKVDFALRLKTLVGSQGSALSHIVVQKRPKASTRFRIRKTLRDHGLVGLVSAIYYGLLLRFNPGIRKNLSIFRARTTPEFPQNNWPTDFTETESVNAENIYKLIKNLQPDLIVVWGSGMIDNRILDLAPYVINYHMGLAPFYRGAVANQQALLADDFDHIGSTIHVVNSNPDAGGIYETILANKNLPVDAMFTDLNDRSEQAYLTVIENIITRKQPSLKTQDLSQGKNYLLKNWTPQVRYRLARKIQRHKND